MIQQGSDECKPSGGGGGKSPRNLQISENFKTDLKILKVHLMIFKALKPICPCWRLLQAFNLFAQIQGFQGPTETLR